MWLSESHLLADHHTHLMPGWAIVSPSSIVQTYIHRTSQSLLRYSGWVSTSLHPPRPQALASGQMETNSASTASRI